MLREHVVLFFPRDVSKENLLLASCSPWEDDSICRSNKEGLIVRGWLFDCELVTFDDEFSSSVGLESLLEGTALVVMICVTSLEKNFSSRCSSMSAERSVHALAPLVKDRIQLLTAPSDRIPLEHPMRASSGTFSK